MWIVKGILLGLVLFIGGNLLYLLLVVARPRANYAIGLSVITGMTIHNNLFWAALIASLVIGCAITGSWPVKR